MSTKPARTSRKRRNIATDTAPAAPTTERIDTAAPADDSAPVAVAGAKPTLSSVPPVREFTVPHAALKTALGKITNVADKHSKLPILAHVAIRSTGAEVDLVATDLDVWLSVRLATGAGAASFGTTVPAHKMSALIKTLPDGEIACAPGEGYLKITSGKVIARVSAIPDRDFPKIPAHPEAFTSADAKVLRAAIEATLFSTCRDETRFHLAGAFLECDGKTLTVVTTDGHRLTKVRSEWAWDGPSLASGILIPQKGLQELRRMLTGASTCEIGRNGRYLFVRVDSSTLIVKLTDAQFPPYEQVIPKDYRQLITVASKPLVKALERAKLVTSETRGVALKMTRDSLTVACDNPDVGDLTEALDADYHGPDAKWGVNPTYMLELLAEIDADSVTIAFKAELDPIVVRSTDDAAMRPLREASIVGVIMPMRI